MKSNIVRIGNSRGIRIPKLLLQQCGLREAVELEVHGDRLVVRPATKARTGWEETFREMAREGDDALLDRKTVSATRWDRTEWEW